ncbi:ATPase, T2SS/T4P/T4SS family [Burkholderia sp. MR1-5-21]
MSMFQGTDAPAEPKRGLFARMKAMTSGFVSASPSAMPIVGNTPVDGKAPPELREPRFKTTSRPSKPIPPVADRPMMGGMRLRMMQAEFADVEAIDAVALASVVDDKAPSTATSIPAGAPVDADETAPTHYAVEPHASPVEVAQPAAAAHPMADRVDAAPDAGYPQAVAPHDAPHATPDESAHNEPTLRRIGLDSIESPFASMETGLPRLVSADAIAFKRVLCQRGADAALRITEAARREFIAVELQAGIATVVATQRFHESELYATYLKDLARAHIAVQEEMVAAEDVIAALYAKEQRSPSVIPETSRAIGAFRDVIEAATGYGASDSHWEYRDYAEEVELRFRVDGVLYSYRKMPKALVRRALSAAYQDLVQRNTNSGETFQPTAPQSAMIPLAAYTDIVNIRWQSAPLVGGFDVGLRLLDGNFRHVNVRLPQDMGLEPSQLAIIDALGHVSGGVTILTGETGSAKTTMLRALSYMLPDRDVKKQFAVNEPSEVPAPWLSDISIQRRPGESDEEANRKSAEVIRTLMRMDPDDVTVGEIRDAVVASLVAELALTGHPVRTTLHADDIIGAVMRLVGGRLRLAMDEVASEKFLNALGNQKLIPLLCPHCKRPARDVLPASKLATLETKFGLDTSAMACRNDDGCAHCRRPGLFTRTGKVAAGIKGQTLAMELYRPTPEFLDRVAERDWRGATRVYRTSRISGFGDADMTGKTVYEHALYKAACGIIDPRFIDESMRSFDTYRVYPDRDGRMPS